MSIEGSVTVSVQAVPVYTIPLGDLHMDRGEDLMWTCEAFGIPDVNYQWLRNGIVFNANGTYFNSYGLFFNRF